MNKPYITITHGIRGYYAVMVWWNPEMGGFWEPWSTGFGSYATIEDAIPEAEDWAAAEEIEFKRPLPHEHSTPQPQKAS